MGLCLGTGVSQGVAVVTHVESTWCGCWSDLSRVRVKVEVRRVTMVKGAAWRH